MKVIITETLRKEKEIEVDLPYYFRHDLSDGNYTSVCYGKITERKCVMVTESQGNEYSFRIEADYFDSIAESGYGSYFEEQHKSTEGIFEAMKKRATDFITTEGDSIEFQID